MMAMKRRFMDNKITTLTKEDIEKCEKKMKDMKMYLLKLAKKGNYEPSVMMMIQNSLSDILDDYIPIV